MPDSLTASTIEWDALDSRKFADEEALLGHDFKGFVHPDDRPSLQRQWQDVLSLNGSDTTVR